jgi:Domain of unknown function (DUF4091)
VRTLRIAVAWVLLGGGVARAQPALFAVPDEVRLRRQDAQLARAAGQPLAAAGAAVTLDAFRGETVAFQVALVAGAGPIGTASLTIAPFGGAGAPRAELFREHTVAVTRRSGNDRRQRESLGWSPAARPADSDMLGDVPDALIPIAVDPAPIEAPPFAPAGTVAEFWIDVVVPDATPAGLYTAAAQVTAEQVPLARFSIRVRVAPTPLPFRAASVFVAYSPSILEQRIGDGPLVERQLWQLLHAHQIDAVAPLADVEEARRLADAYDGTLFTAARGYDGPGAALPPAVAAIGTYGALKGPSPASVDRAAAIAALLHPRVPDLFVYAIDERCDDPRAGDWVRALKARPDLRGVSVGQTCSRPASRQAADIAILTADTFGFDAGRDAAAAGKRAWIYNGVLPATGTLLLDADPRGLTANGWIAAAADIPRWFYWESTFWDDDNRGGRGPVDPFVTAESFHNADGDRALGDGLLLYPGRQSGRFAAHSLGVPAVLPSLRLQALRRGIQDAGIIALAMRDQPKEAARIVAAAIPRVLDETNDSSPASWASFVEARAQLRQLVVRSAPMTGADVEAAFRELRVHRGRAVRPPARRPPIAPLSAVVAVLLAGLLIARHRRR